MFTKFSTDSDGIYYVDSIYKINIMKPDFKQPEMFYDDYRWFHETNHIGIRNDKNLERADIVVLGDSMIYGLGLNLEDTLCRLLERKTHLTVANLGVQGDYPPTEYLRLKHLGLFLKPKIVLFFINGSQDKNDFAFYTPLKKYIDQITQEPALNYARGVRASDYLGHYQKNKLSFLSSIFNRMVIIKLLRRGKRLLDHIYWKSAVVKQPMDLKDAMSQILMDAKSLSKLNAAELIVVSHLTFSRQNDQFNLMSQEICEANHIKFLNLNAKVSNAVNLQGFFLSDKLHYSRQGNNYVSDLLVQYFRDQSYF